MRRRYRLRTDAQFKRVRSEGRSWAHPLLVLYALPNDEGVTRVGFSVGKRVGKAVARNRIKRLLREATRIRFKDIRPGYDLIWIARAPIATATFREVGAAVEQLLQRSCVGMSMGTGEGESRPEECRPDSRQGRAQGL